MPRAWFDDGFADHPKVEALSDSAFRLHVAGILYASRLLTDGVIPRARVPRLVPGFRAKALTELLGGVWHEPGHACPDCPQLDDGEIVIHGYLDHQKSRAQVESERAQTSQRQARWRDSRRDKPSRNAVTDGVTNAALSSPLPTPPQPPAERGARSRAGQQPGPPRLPTVDAVLADHPPADRDLNLAKVREIRANGNGAHR